MTVSYSAISRKSNFG